MNIAAGGTKIPQPVRARLGMDSCRAVSSGAIWKPEGGKKKIVPLYIPWDCKKLDMTERLTLSFHIRLFKCLPVF